MKELVTIIRYLFDPHSSPCNFSYYNPLDDLIKADENNNAALLAVREMIGDSLFDNLEASCSEYGEACSAEAFDRGFRVSARLVLQLIQENTSPMPLGEKRCNHDTY